MIAQNLVIPWRIFVCGKICCTGWRRKEGDLVSLVDTGRNLLKRPCNWRLSLRHYFVVTFLIVKTGLASSVATGGDPLLKGDFDWRRLSLSFDYVVEGFLLGGSGIGRFRGPMGPKREIQADGTKPNPTTLVREEKTTPHNHFTIS
jgi:hypothetical protein